MTKLSELRLKLDRYIDVSQLPFLVKRHQALKKAFIVISYNFNLVDFCENLDNLDFSTYNNVGLSFTLNEKKKALDEVADFYHYSQQTPAKYLKDVARFATIGCESRIVAFSEKIEKTLDE